MARGTILTVAAATALLAMAALQTEAGHDLASRMAGSDWVSSANASFSSMKDHVQPIIGTATREVKPNRESIDGPFVLSGSSLLVGQLLPSIVASSRLQGA